jgi:hypothetical protein
MFFVAICLQRRACPMWPTPWEKGLKQIASPLLHPPWGVLVYAGRTELGHYVLVQMFTGDKVDKGPDGHRNQLEATMQHFALILS